MSRARKPILYSLRSKLLATLVVLLATSMFVATWFAISLIRKNIRREMEAHLKADSSMSWQILRERLEKLESLVSLTAADNTVKVTLDLGIVPQLKEHLRKIVSANELDFYKITDSRGVCVSHSATVSEGTSFLQEQITAALQGKPAGGFTLVNYHPGSTKSSAGTTISHARKELMMVAVSPIRVRKQIGGTLSFGRLIANDKGIINSTRKNVKAEMVIWQKGTGVISSSLAEDNFATLEAPLTEVFDKAMLEKEQLHTTDLAVDDTNFLVAIYPLRDLRGNTVAFSTLLKNIEALKTLEKQTIKRMVVISFFGVCVAIVFASLVTRSISKPIKKTVEAMIAVTEKDDLTQRVKMNVKGEVGKLVSAFNNMVETIRESRAGLEELANTLDQKVKDRTRELEEAQKELVNKAMEAGRAQLSAIVLHNIGNALTPVKVQTEEMKSGELKQVSGYLEKCYLALNEHIGDLKDYVNEDPRGKEVFSYMGKLVDSLKERVREQESITRKIDGAVSYISEILTLQQAYAASEQETKERTDLNLLIKDAILMQTGPLEKRGIIVRKDLAPNLPKLLIDKNRLMQVIVNFIKNSYEAIDELNDSNKEKWIAFKSFSREGSVWLEITDSGIGIEPDEIETIFEFGKSHKGSSGFGLYYCKMFVEANNGTLTINSPGRGKGAMVSVTLPAANSVPRQMSKAKKLGHEGARLCV